MSPAPQTPHNKLINALQCAPCWHIPVDPGLAGAEITTAALTSQQSLLLCLQMLHQRCCIRRNGTFSRCFVALLDTTHKRLTPFALSPSFSSSWQLDFLMLTWSSLLLLLAFFCATPLNTPFAHLLWNAHTLIFFLTLGVHTLFFHRDKLYPLFHTYTNTPFWIHLIPLCQHSPEVLSNSVTNNVRNFYLHSTPFFHRHNLTFNSFV